MTTSQARAIDKEGRMAARATGRTYTNIRGGVGGA